MNSIFANITGVIKTPVFIFETSCPQIIIEKNRGQHQAMRRKNEICSKIQVITATDTDSVKKAVVDSSGGGCDGDDVQA